LATVYRDNNKDDILDMTVGSEEEGLFGINLHRANAKRESTQVDKWSAGCQVVGNPNTYDAFIILCKHAAENWGDSFSYTLLLEEWFDSTKTEAYQVSE
jgi:hypothetical protein